MEEPGFARVLIYSPSGALDPWAIAPAGVFGKARPRTLRSSEPRPHHAGTNARLLPFALRPRAAICGPVPERLFEPQSKALGRGKKSLYGLPIGVAGLSDRLVHLLEELIGLMQFFCR